MTQIRAKTQKRGRWTTDLFLGDNNSTIKEYDKDDVVGVIPMYDISREKALERFYDRIINEYYKCEIIYRSIEIL